MPDINVRKARLTEAPVILQLVHESMSSYCRDSGIPDSYIEATSEDLEAIENAISSGVVFVALSEDDEHLPSLYPSEKRSRQRDQECDLRGIHPHRLFCEILRVGHLARPGNRELSSFLLRESRKKLPVLSYAASHGTQQFRHGRLLPGKRIRPSFFRRPSRLSERSFRKSTYTVSAAFPIHVFFCFCISAFGGAEVFLLHRGPPFLLFVPNFKSITYILGIPSKNMFDSNGEFNKMM